MSNVNVFEMAAEAAKKAGAVCPEAVAEYLSDNLTVVDTVAGPQVVVRNGVTVEPLDFVMSRLQITKNVGALFHGGDLDVRNLDHDLYCAIRKHNPELLGLRHKR
jgi:hypothetical protein